MLSLILAGQAVLAQNEQPQVLYCAQFVSFDRKTGQITVSYYDYFNEKEKTALFLLSKEVKLENFSRIEELKTADVLTITYTTQNGKNFATSIYLEKLEEDEEVPLAAWDVLD